MNANYDDGTLREAFAGLAADAPPAGELCFSAEQIWDAIETRVGVEQRLRIIDHMAECPACAESWRLAMRLGARPPAQWEILVERMRKWLESLSAPHVRTAIAAAALVVVAVLLPWRAWVREPAADDPTYRRVEAPNRGAVKSAMTPGQTLAREGCQLRWTGPEGAVYDLVVKTEDLDVVTVVHSLTDPEYLIPAKPLEAIPPGGRLLWFVEATLPTGETVTSPTFATPVK